MADVVPEISSESEPEESDDLKLSRLNAVELRALVKTLLFSATAPTVDRTRFLLVNPDTKHFTCQWCGADVELNPADVAPTSSDDSPDTRKRSKR